MKLLVKIFLIIGVFLIIITLVLKSSLLSEKGALNFSGKKALTINDEGLRYQILTETLNVGEALAESKIKLDEFDEITPSKNTEILPGMNISINRQFDVKIEADGGNLDKKTFSMTVEDLILENNISLSHLDTVEPSKQTRLRDGLKIVITRIKTEEIISEDPIEFEIIKKKDDELYWGDQQAGQAGENGTKEVAYRVDYENGKEVSRVKLSSKITKPPIPRIVKIGTKIKIGKSDSGIASWYNADKFKCASRDFPPGTWLRVTSRDTGRQVFVQVAGYGPQEGTGKVIDIDNAAFKKLAPLDQGTARVKIEEVLNKGFNPSLLEQ